MWCLKCGKDTKDEQVFCPQCLAVMEKYPVKADVHIQLPNHTVRDNPKKNSKKKRAPSAEEQVEILRSRNRKLLFVILVLVLLLGGASYALAHELNTPDIVENWAKDNKNYGKNFTVETPTE